MRGGFRLSKSRFGIINKFGKKDATIRIHRATTPVVASGQEGYPQAGMEGVHTNSSQQSVDWQSDFDRSVAIYNGLLM